MSITDPIGIGALGAAASQWLGHAWAIGPAMALSIAALVARVRAGRRVFFTLDSEGAGRWPDGRACLAGTCEIEGPTDPEGFVTLYSYRAAKQSAQPSRPTLAADVRVRLSNGAAVLLAAGRSVPVHHTHDAKRCRTVTRQDLQTSPTQYDVRIARGAPAWVVGALPVPSEVQGWREASVLTPESGVGLELHFEPPRPPNTDLVGPQGLLWLSAITGALLAFADTWTPILLTIEGLAAALAVVSLWSTAKGPSPAKR